MTDKPKPVLIKSPVFSELPDVELPAGSDVELTRIMRRAVGLDDLADSNERLAGEMVWVMHYVWSILSVVASPHDRLEHPRKIAGELEKLQLDLGEIRRRIGKIDYRAVTWLNQFGSKYYQELFGTMEELSRHVKEAPPETRTVPAAVAAIRRLERAIPKSIAFATHLANSVPGTGRKKNWKVHAIALVVAGYIRDVTGDPPGPRQKYSGSDFERTLTEIFELFEINADAQAPAKAALLKLSEDT